MKKAAIAAAVISLALAGSAFAADNGQLQTFDQKKTSILKKLEDRINMAKEAQDCVQAAKTMDDLKVCREKHMAHMTEMEKMK